MEGCGGEFLSGTKKEISKKRKGGADLDGRYRLFGIFVFFGVHATPLWDGGRGAWSLGSGREPSKRGEWWASLALPMQLSRPGVHSAAVRYSLQGGGTGGPFNLEVFPAVVGLEAGTY